MRALAGDRELRPLGLARAAFGLVFLLRTTPVLAAFDPAFLRGNPGWLGWPVGGWHVGLALDPALAKLLVVARTLAAVALMLGVRTRIAGLIAGISGYLLLAQDAFGYFHHLHLLYLGAILFALVDADSAIALRVTPARSPASSLLLMRAFTASIYIWAAIGKLASEWGTGRALALFRASGALHVPAALASPVVEIAVIATELSLGCLAVVTHATSRADRRAAPSRDVRDRRARRHDRLADGRAAPGVHRQRAASAGHAMSDCSHISSDSSGPGSTTLSVGLNHVHALSITSPGSTVASTS